MANQIAQLSTYTGHLQQIQESEPIHLFMPGFFPSFLNWLTHIYTWLPFPKAAPSASTWVQLRDVIREEMWLSFEKNRRPLLGCPEQVSKCLGLVG